MPGSPNTSFIPKHTANKVERRNAPRQMFVGTLLVRILFFSVLIASVATFFYEKKINKELATEVVSFRAATSSFNDDEQKLTTVTEIDKKITLASERLAKTVSVTSLLKALETSTIVTAEIEDLEYIRKNDNEVEMKVSVVTDSFDSVIFQRMILEESQVFGGVEISDVTINNLSESEAEGTAVKNTIGFIAEIIIDPQTLATPLAREAEVLVPVVEQSVTMPGMLSEETELINSEVTNQDNI